MGRIGFKVSKESVETISKISKLPNIKMEGMFTHFAKADEFDKSYTFAQHEKFLWMKEQLEKMEFRFPIMIVITVPGLLIFRI